ncbi:MAG: hypothetical protein KY455_11200 [Euryarchaeota archaeon]|nr:hypothetical protein [Euryarchaeota archaeon]
MPFRPTRIVIHPDVDATYRELERQADAKRQPAVAIWKGFQTALKRIKRDGQWGEAIPRIPKTFRSRYGVMNLYCVDLASFHRCFYTIRCREVIFLDLVDHAEYDRLFGRKKR